MKKPLTFFCSLCLLKRVAAWSGPLRMSLEPVNRRTFFRNSAVVAASVAGLQGAGLPALAETSSLPASAYTKLGGEMEISRILNGMWQLSGAHGFTPKLDPALDEMKKLANAGYTTFDLADHYGPAEPFVGQFRAREQAQASDLQFLTKWVPRPGAMPRSIVETAIDTSRQRMNMDRLDLLQFHWWDYGNPQYLVALQHMQDMVGEKKIRHLGLTNFDTKHTEIIANKGINLVSNQVQYSVLDTRPAQLMAPMCEEKGIKLLCYGTLLGGLLSDKWLDKPVPVAGTFDTVSQLKYYNMIRGWGDWGLFQSLLTAMKGVADKHDVSISNVAVRWVLDQPAVGGAIVGARLGLTDHTAETGKVFGLKLDADDKARIAEVQAKGRNLLSVIGDCGDEYRG